MSIYLDIACLVVSITSMVINVVLLRRNIGVTNLLQDELRAKKEGATDVHVDLHNRLLQLQGSSYARAYMNIQDRTKR
jgi:hypothetical protein